MTQFESNSLKKALAGGDAGIHPDSDLLTALAENSLLPREREAVLGHLAVCPECRQVLSLATEGMPEVASAKRPFLVARGERRAWRVLIPSLAAAAAIVALSTMLARREMKSPVQSPMVAANRVEESPAPQAPQPQAKHKEARRATSKPATEPNAPTQERLSISEQQGISHTTIEGKEANTHASAPAASAMQLRRTLAQPPAPAFANAVTAHALATAREATAAWPHWRINEQGQPERAFGDGQWRPVLPNQSARMNVLAVFGGEVWVGGEKSEVMRSFDNGVSWRIVSLPQKNGREHTIAHIRFDSAQEVAIEASDGTMWTTSDGGESWK